MPELWMKNQKILTFQEKEGVASSIDRIHEVELLPLCLSQKCTVETFNEWMNKRKIPLNREGLDEMIAEFGNDWLCCKNKASLSDQYWVKYRLEEWSKINFFTRLYSHDIGDLAFMPWAPKRKKISSDSPDLMTNGVLRKRWKQNSDKTSSLLKAGSKIICQEPLSEVLVSVLLEQLEVIPFVRYDFCVEGITLCSKCDNFITADTELVPASYIYHLEERPENVSIYSHLLHMCDKFEIEGAQEFIDGMIFIDTLTGNKDRNLGNIAFVRNVNTLKLETGPLFDFGASYWSSGKIDNQVKSKLFGDVEKRIFKRMKKKCDLEYLRKSEGYRSCIESYPAINEERKRELISAITKRNEMLCRDMEVEMEM